MCFARSSADGGSNNVQKILIAESKRGDCFGDQCLYGAARLKQTLTKINAMVWIGFVWPRIGFSGWIL